MTINRNNYEVFIIDYYDGKLNPVESAELLFFLSQNPDLEDEFNTFENIQAEPVLNRFDEVFHLYKHFSDFKEITDHNFEELCIAATEGELDETSTKKLYRYLQEKPEKKKELDLYHKVILAPDLSLTFPQKKQLKHKKTTIISIARPLFYLAAAAAIFLILILTVLFDKPEGPQIISDARPVKEPGRVDIIVPDDDNSVYTTENLISNKTKKALIVSGEKNTPNLADFEEETTDINPSNADYPVLLPIEIKKIDYIAVASPIIPVIRAVPSDRKPRSSVIGDIGIRDFIAEKVMEKDNFDLWALAEAGVKGINYLTESDVKIARKLNNAGKMTDIAIDSESFGISAPLKK
ncbi:MAG: hypothetical protein R6W78_08655 [Bacteroidales bacterium]